MFTFEITTTRGKGMDARTLVLWRGYAQDREHAVAMFRAEWNIDTIPMYDDAPHGAVPDGAPGIPCGPEGDPA